MNSLLMKHRPKDMEKEKWEEMWKNSHTLLQPLANVLKDMKSGSGQIKSTDFDTPNHYAKLVAELIEAQTINKILELLPDSVSK